MRPPLAALALAIALGCSRPAPVLDRFGPVPAFSLVDQRGEAFASAQLAGDVLVVNFIFTSCPMTCPMLTEKMAGLAARLPQTDGHGKPLPIRLLSFSVDPERDQPEVLARFAAAHHATDPRWRFLTGEQAQIDAVLAGFRLGAGRIPREGDADPASYDVVHSEKFVLVDAEGQIRGFYSADEPGLAALARDATALAGG